VQSALLVQRDISLDIPISHILLPGINLTTSWFWTKNYTVDNITAITDLFNMGYRRFGLDVYWNNATSSFQLCPEQIVANITTNSTSVVTTTITTQITTTVSSSATTIKATVTSTLTSSATSVSPTHDPVVPISLPNGYNCAPEANLQIFLDTVKDILVSTDNQLRQAGLIFLILNIRTLPLVANSTNDLSIPSALSLSNQINTTLGDWLYTPTELASERQNINSTFLSDTDNPIVDIPAYYSVNINNVTQIASTPNGWPSTRYLFETQGRRLFVGFGSIEVPSTDYDTSEDISIIFPSGTFDRGTSLVPSTSIQSQPEVCLGPPGQVFGPSGSLNFNSSNSTGNYSFALSAAPNLNDALSYSSLQSIVSCGLSPIITSPLQDTFSGNSSPIDPIAGTIWSWLPPDEPKNTSLPLNGTENVVACAALLADTGRWVVLDCNTELSLACRVDNQAYEVLPAFFPFFWYPRTLLMVVGNWASGELLSSIYDVSSRYRLCSTSNTP